MTWCTKSSRKFKSERRGETQGNAGKSSLQSKMPRSQPRNRMDHDGARGLGVRHVVLCASVLCMYIYTALPSVPGGDSGELLAEACHGGIPHPPGYPLLNILHNILSRLVHSAVIVLLWPKPPGIIEIGVTSKVAFAANIMAGVFGAGTSVMICLAVEEWTHGSKEAYSPAAAICVALLFSFSPLAWEYSTGTEVFALNNFLVATAMYLTARSVKRPSMNIARVGATVCGLALSNQHASVLVLVPLAFSVLFSLKRALLLSWRAAVELGVLWLPLGLSSYAVLVVSARHPQQGSWGDLSSFWGFARHVFRVEYGTFRLGVVTANAEGALDRVRQYLVDSSLQTIHVGPPLALLGIGWALKAPRASESKKEAGTFAIGLVSAWTSYVFIWHGVLSNISLHHPMSRAVHARFWMQPNLVLCLAAGGGLGVVVNVTIRTCRLGFSARYRLSRQSAVEVESLLLSAAIAAGMVWLRWDTVNRGVWSGRSHVCEGFRVDVTQISLQMMPYPWWANVQAKLHPGVVFPPILPGVSTRRNSAGNAALVTRFIAANIKRGRPIFLDMQAVDESEIGDAGAYRGFNLIPHGLTYRVLPRLTVEKTERWHNVVMRQLHSLDESMEPVSGNEYHPGTWEFAAISVFWDAHYQAGLFFLSYAVGAWIKTPRAVQRPQVLPALRKASSLLRRTLEEVDLRGTFSSSRSDLLKNTALAEVRLYHALQIATAVAVASASASARTPNKKIISTSQNWDSMHSDIIMVKARCLELIPRLLTEALDDKDAEAFGKFYIELRGEG